MARQAPDLHEREIGITPFDCPSDNYFLIPLMYLLAAVGIGWLVQLLVRWSRSDLPAAVHWTVVAGLAVLVGAAMATFVAAGMMNAAGLRDKGVRASAPVLTTASAN